MSEEVRMMYQPEDTSVSSRFVTAIGESAMLYPSEKEHKLGIDDDVILCEDGHFSEEQSFPAKKHKAKFGKGTSLDYSVKTGKVQAPEIDVRSGLVKPVPEDQDLKLGKEELKLKTAIACTADSEPIGPNTIANLNIHIREDAWNRAIVKSGRLPRADNFVMPNSFNSFAGLQEDNFDDYSHLNSRVYDEYLKGCVVLGTRKAVSTLLNASHDLKIGTTGVIIDQCMTPSYDGLYEEGPCSQYTSFKTLGKGSFGTVDFCVHNKTKQKYVKKKVAQRFSKKEVEVLMQLQHENITGFKGYISRDGVHEIMMEYGGHSLKTFISKNPDWREKWTLGVLRTVALQGFSALSYMYDRFGILHLDIKPENVCIQMDPLVLKITDFGTSKTPQEPITMDGWTPEYMSPEACRLALARKSQNLPPNFVVDLEGTADVFSFALTLCFMKEGNHTVCSLWQPEQMRDPDMFMQLRTQYIITLAMQPDFMKTVAIKDEYPREFRELLLKTLEGDPHDRLTASQACQLITGFDSDGVAPGSEGSDLHLDHDLEMFDPPPSPMELSLRAPPPLPATGGKDIKNQLRRKIRRKVSTPYSRQVSKMEVSVSATPVEDANETQMGTEALPNFNMFMDE